VLSFVMLSEIRDSQLAAIRRQVPSFVDLVDEGEARLAIALVAGALTLLVFTPRFVLWRGVGDYLVHRAPEYGRANALLMQVADPWSKNFDPMHRVLAWRLFFPVVWHYAHLPPRGLLAVPHVGCVVVLWLVAWLTHRRLAQWKCAWLVTLLFAPLPWFFVSTGWLGYFDSWFVLGLLLVAFVPSRVVLGATCLVTPWIDERFVVALPLTLAVRAAALGLIQRRAWREIAIDSTVAAAAVLPYPVLRLVDMLRGDPETGIYIQAHLQTVGNVAWTRFAAALWSGFRASWVVIVAGLWLWGKRAGGKWAVLLAVIALVTAVGGLRIAIDMSRTMMTLAPLLLFAAWSWESWRAPAHAWLLPAVVVANFLLPATHELWFQKFTIDHFPTEWNNWRGPPPPTFVAAELIGQATDLLAQGQVDGARQKLDAALEIDPTYAVAYAHRAAIRMNARDFDGAFIDADQAQQKDPTLPYPYFLRGYLRALRGERDPARQDLQMSLQLSSPAWTFRPQAEQLLQQLSSDPPPAAQ